MIVVTVMPTWAPESSVERWVRAVRTALPRRSPAPGWSSATAGSTVTRENSPATKTAVPTVSSTPRPISNHSASMRVIRRV